MKLTHENLQSLGLEKQGRIFADLIVYKSKYGNMLFKILDDNKLQIHPAFKDKLDKIIGDDGQLKIQF